MVDVSTILMAAVLVVCMGGVFWFATTLPSGDNSDITVSILHINDHHSHLEEGHFTITEETDGLNGVETEEVRVFYGGFPRITALMDKLVTESTADDVIKLHAGDAITGTTYYSLFNGKADAELMSLICFDAMVVGNHEFDDGDQQLADFIDSLQNDKCELPVLGANVVPGDNSPLKGKLGKYHIKELSNGEKVGIVGIDVKDKTMNSSFPDDGTILTDELEAAKEAVAELEEQGINKIIILSHVGITEDIALFEQIDGVDVVVGGDSHTLLGEGPHDPFDSYPVRLTKNGACVVQAWEYAHGIGKLDIVWDKEGKIKSCSGGMKFPLNAAKMQARDVEDRPFLSEENAAIIAERLTAFDHFVDVDIDTESSGVLEQYSAQVSDLRQTVIADVPSNICYERFPGQGRSTVCTAADTAKNGGGVCNIVAKAFMTLEPTVDFAIQNAGGCRTDIESGDYTIDDAFTMLPFSNTLVKLQLTGEEVVQVLNQALTYGLSEGGSTGAYPYASGLRFKTDATKPEIFDVEVNPRLSGEWTAIDAAKTYTLVTNSFIATGKDGYTLFGEKTYEDTYREYGQSFVDYAEIVNSFEDLPIEEYSTQDYTGPPYGEEGLAAQTRL